MDAILPTLGFPAYVKNICAGPTPVYADEAARLEAAELNFIDMLYKGFMVLSILLGALHRFIPGRAARNLYSLVFGLGFMIALFKLQVLVSLLSASFVYLMVKLRVPNYHIISLVFCFALISACHIYRMITDYGGWHLDFTGPQMVLTLKLVAFAFSCKDGENMKDDKKKSEVLPYESKNAVLACPSPLEFFGYVYSYFGILAGPFCEFRMYENFLNMNYKNAKSKYSFLGRLLRAVLEIAIFFPIMQFGSTVFCYDYVKSPAFFAPVLNSSVFSVLREYAHIWVYLAITAFVLRTRYYVGWLLAESGCLSAGFGYNGANVKGEDDWSGARNMFTFEFEKSQNLVSVVKNWNTGTARFLKHYINDRVAKAKDPKTGKPKYGKAIPNLVTFSVSALWHGFYGSYYLFFLTFFFVGKVAEAWRQSFRHLVVETKIDSVTGKREERIKSSVGKNLYDCITFLATLCIIPYIAAGFVLLDASDALSVWGNLKFAGHIAAVAVFVLCKIFGPILRPKRQASVASSTVVSTPAAVKKNE